MNYEANTTKWKLGDLVIHDADAKSAEMLMVVVGYANQNRSILTRYAKANAMNGDKAGQRPEIWENPITHLHDPTRFGLADSLGLTEQGLGIAHGHTPVQSSRPDGDGDPTGFSGLLADFGKNEKARVE